MIPEFQTSQTKPAGWRTVYFAEPCVRQIMKLILLIIATSLLQACSFSHGDLAFTKPSTQDLVGMYSVDHISWLTSKRSEMKKVVLKLFADGSFQTEFAPGVSSSPLIPAKSGRWEMVEDHYGFDLGSRASWGVLFTSTDASLKKAVCLNATPPYKLMFVDCPAGRHHDDILVMKKDR